MCCSCGDMLDVEPEIAVTYTNYFQNEQDVHKTYIDMYAKIREVYFQYQLQPHHKMGLVYDQCNEYYSYANELKSLSVEAFKKVAGTSWILHYNVIFQSNLILDNLYRVQDLPKDRENFYKGHCYFAKGLMYYEIARRWGNAPITRDAKSIDPLGRRDAKVVLDTALSNALRAFDLLKNYDEAVDYNGQKLKKYYAHKGAAAALLANIYAWKGGLFNDSDAYEEAEKYCTLIIENKVGIYKMVDTPEEVCSVVMDRMSSESVFELLNSSIDFGFTTGRFSPGINFHIGANYGYGGYPLNPFGSLSNNQYENLYLIKNDRVKKIWGDEDLRRAAYFWKFDEDGNKTRPSDWYVYYCQMAESLSKQGYIVFISCHPEVREYMRKHRTEMFCAIFPHKSLKDIWISKLQERYYCTKSEKDLRALEHAEKFFDKDIDRLMYECSYGIEWYSNAVYIEEIDYNLESIVESLINSR